MGDMSLDNIYYLTALESINNQNGAITYTITTFSWDRATMQVVTLTTDIGIKAFKQLEDNNRIIAINFDKDKIKPDINSISIKDKIKMAAKSVRLYITSTYGIGIDLCGRCIEASDLLAAILKYLGVYAETVEGWCKYDIEDYGSERSYDEHTWVELKDQNIYIDVTADQFNYGMEEENKFKGITVSKGLPHGMVYDEPEDYEDDNEW